MYASVKDSGQMIIADISRVVPVKVQEVLAEGGNVGGQVVSSSESSWFLQEQQHVSMHFTSALMLHQ